MNILIFDTETTGLKNAQLVQLGAILKNEDRELGCLDIIAQPEGWEIEESAQKIHGISTEMAYDVGSSLENIVNIFDDYLDLADVVVGHNLAFDSRVMHRAFGRFDLPFKTKLQHCTMLKSTKLCKLPKPSGNKGFKNPKLEEAFRHFEGFDFENAHNAMCDARATEVVYDHLLELGVV